jgi:WD40 repeat protein
VSSDARLLASRTRQGHVYLHEFETGKRLHHWKDKAGMVGFAAFSPDGSRLASGTDGAPIRIWEVPTGNELERAAHRIGSSGMFVQDNAHMLLGVHNHMALAFHDIRDTRATFYLPEPVEGCEGLSITANGKLVLLSCRVTVVQGLNFRIIGQELLLCESASKKLICRITQHKSRAATPSLISPDGRLLAIAGADAMHIVPLTVVLTPRPLGEQPRIEHLWEALGHDSPLVAYRAIAAIPPGSKEAIAQLRDKLAVDKRGFAQPSSDKSRIRLTRAVDLLERIGGREAIAILHELAAAVPGTPVSADANRTALRLNARSP